MKSRDDILTLLRREKPALMARWPIASLALFGSVARGEQTEGSDVDLLVDLAQPMGFAFFDLIDELEQLLGGRVDLIERSQIKPRAWPYIAAEVIDV